jgi:hypothetical protein
MGKKVIIDIEGYEVLVTAERMTDLPGKVLLLSNNSTHYLIAGWECHDTPGQATLYGLVRYDAEFIEPYRQAMQILVNEVTRD